MLSSFFLYFWKGFYLGTVCSRALHVPGHFLEDVWMLFTWPILDKLSLYTNRHHSPSWGRPRMFESFYVRLNRASSSSSSPSQSNVHAFKIHLLVWIPSAEAPKEERPELQKKTYKWNTKEEAKQAFKELLKEKVGEGLAEREGRGTEVGLGFRDAGCRLGEVGACLLLYSY